MKTYMAVHTIAMKGGKKGRGLAPGLGKDPQNNLYITI
jgi:hypothetical protein